MKVSNGTVSQESMFTIQYGLIWDISCMTVSDTHMLYHKT